MSTSSQTMKLRWSSSAEEDKRFNQIVRTVLALMLVATLIVSYVKVPAPAPVKLVMEPERLVKLILERKKPLPVPKPKEQTAAEREALRKAEEERKKRLELEQKKIQEERKQQTEEQRKQAEERRKLDEQRLKDEAERRKTLDAERQKQMDERQRAEAERQRQEDIRRQAEAERQRKDAERQRVVAEKAKGAAAARSIFEDVKSVAGEPSVSAVKGSAGLVSGKNAASQGAGEGVPQADILRQRGASAGNSSQGIDTNALPSLKGAGGSGLAGRDTTRVGEVAMSDSGNSNETAGRKKGSKEGRGERDLNLVFEQNKDALYKLYERARRANPSLSGKVVIELTISASGDVLDVRIVSTDLNDAELENKIKLKVKTFNFGAKDVETITVTYPIDFVPS